MFSLESQVGGSAREINVPGGDQDRVTVLALGVTTEKIPIFCYCVTNYDL